MSSQWKRGQRCREGFSGVIGRGVVEEVDGYWNGGALEAVQQRLNEFCALIEHNENIDFRRHEFLPDTPQSAAGQ